MNPSNKPLPKDLILTTVDKDKFEQKVKVTPVPGKVLGFDANGRPVMTSGGPDTPISVENGGTGGTTQATALSGLGALFGSVETKTTSFTVTNNDRGKFFRCAPTGSMVVTLPSASSASGVVFAILNANPETTGVVEVADPVGSLRFFYGHQASLFFSDGAKWHFLGFLIDDSENSIPVPRWNGDGATLELFDAANGEFNGGITNNDSSFILTTASGSLALSPGASNVLFSFNYSRQYSVPDMGGTAAILAPNAPFGNSLSASSGTVAAKLGAGLLTFTPTGNVTLGATGTDYGAPYEGAIVSMVITTAGTTSYTVTFGANFKSTGTLSTGTVSGKVFTVSFVFDGTNWCETSRTTAM